MKRLFLIITLFVSTIFPLVANDRVFLFEDHVLTELKTHKRIVLVNKTPGKAEMLPQLPIFHTFLNERNIDECSLSFECIYLLDIPKMLQKTEDIDAVISVLLSASLDIESLTGLEYYSESSKRMKLLYLDSQFLEKKPGNWVKSEAEPAFSASALVLQEDTSFGKNTYRYEWLANEDMCAFSSINETPLSYGIVKAAPKEGLLNVVVIIPVDDTVYLYAYTAIKTNAFLPSFMVERVKKSLVNRIDALKIWFEKQLE